VDSANETGAITATEKELLKKKAALLEEKLRLERAVKSNAELMRSSSELRQKLYPTPRDFTTDPVLQYALRLVGGDVFGSSGNWDSDPYTESTSTREEWFAKFARLIIMEVPDHLKTEYETKMGGCIDGPLDMSVIITELESKKEQMTPCTDEVLWMPSPTASPMAQPTTPPTASPMVSVVAAVAVANSTAAPCTDDLNATFANLKANVRDCASLKARVLKDAAKGKDGISFLCFGPALQYCKLSCKVC
jgi:hypothetical protein